MNPTETLFGPPPQRLSHRANAAHARADRRAGLATAAGRSGPATGGDQAVRPAAQPALDARFLRAARPVPRAARQDQHVARALADAAGRRGLGYQLRHRVPGGGGRAPRRAGAADRQPGDPARRAGRVGGVARRTPRAAFPVPCRFGGAGGRHRSLGHGTRFHGPVRGVAGTGHRRPAHRLPQRGRGSADRVAHPCQPGAATGRHRMLRRHHRHL